MGYVICAGERVQVASLGPSPHTGGSGRFPRSIRKQCVDIAPRWELIALFPARESWSWPCVGSRRPDFRRCFWRCLRNGDYRRDATFSVSPSGAPSRSAPCLICCFGIVSGRLGHLDP
jgi:hypothetical protein